MGITLDRLYEVFPITFKSTAPTDKGFINMFMYSNGFISQIFRRPHSNYLHLNKKKKETVKLVEVQNRFISVNKINYFYLKRDCSGT